MENLLFQEKFDLVTNLLLSVAVQNENKNALYKAIIEEEDDVACVIMNLITPGDLLQFLQLKDKEGEKYLYSLDLHNCGRQRRLLCEMLNILPEVSQRYEVLSRPISDKSGRTVLHYTAEQAAIDSLQSQELSYQLLSIRDNNGQTPLFTLRVFQLMVALNLVTAEQYLNLLSIRDNEGQTAAEYLLVVPGTEWEGLLKINLKLDWL